MKTRTLLVLLIAVPAWAHGVLKFEHGLWWNGRAFEPKTYYSVDNILRERYDGSDVRTIDLEGRFIIPPYADAHNHVLGDGMNVDQEARQYLRLGIFYVKNPNSSSRLSAPVRERLNKVETVDVAYAFGGITAPGGHPIPLYASIAGHGPFAGWTAAEMADQTWFAVASEDDLAKKWPLILAAKPDFIKTYLDGERALDPKLLASIVRRAHAAGLKVTTHIGSAEDFRRAVRAGSDELAHLPLERITAGDAAAAARAHVTVVTTTLSHRPTNGIADLDAIFRDDLQLLSDAGVRIVLGTDNGERTVLDEADNVRRLTRWPAAAMLNMLTRDTPAQIFPSRKIGRLAAGYEATFLALDADPTRDSSALRRVAMRVKQGHVIEVPPEIPSVADRLLPIAIERGAAQSTDATARDARVQRAGRPRSTTPTSREV
jgi:amidohydrolase family protein